MRKQNELILFYMCKRHHTDSIVAIPIWPKSKDHLLESNLHRRKKHATDSIYILRASDLANVKITIKFKRTSNAFIIFHYLLFILSCNSLALFRSLTHTLNSSHDQSNDSIFGWMVNERFFPFSCSRW